MEFITRCPSCLIAFRVTPTQLKLAGGKVRCGACLTVFMAEQHMDMLDETTNTDSSPASEPISNTEASFETTATSVGSRLETQPEPEFEPEQQALFITEQETSLPEQEPEEDHEEVDYLPDEKPTEPVDTTHRLSPPVSPPEATVNELPASDEIIALGCDSAELDLIDSDNPFINAKQAKTARPRTHPLVIAACLLALLALPAQYIHFHANDLGKQSNNRSWLATFCQLTGCELPILANPSQIVSQHLLVLQHPTVDNALQVDAVLINRAPFAQPFPKLLLRFEDLQGQIVAERQFTPAEYINGELSSEQLFPNNQPVSIRLEIVDPGPNATNYRLLVTN